MDSKEPLKNHIPIPFNVAINLTTNLGFGKGEKITVSPQPSLRLFGIAELDVITKNEVLAR
jgi:hypothetical protein